MNIETLRQYCLSFSGAEETMPFDDKTLVFSVKGKMFCATDITTFELINVKCEPEEAIELRAQYTDVMPGYYMNKKHWNSIRMPTKINQKLIEKWIRDSYQLIVAGLPKKLRQELEREGG